MFDARRRLRHLALFTWVWFALSLCAAIASPLVHPTRIDWVCTSAGSIQLVVQDDDGARPAGASHLDCPLCALAGAPPPPPALGELPTVQPLGEALRPIPSARLAAATAAPLPARGPPVLL